MKLSPHKLKRALLAMAVSPLMALSLVPSANAQAIDIQGILGALQGAGGLSGLMGSLPAGTVNGSSSQLPSVSKAPDLGANQQTDAAANTKAAVAAAAASVQQQEPPTQFQRFVQQSTGRMLPHFGDKIFAVAAALAASPSTSAPAPDDYVLGPGDEVNIRMSGTLDLVQAQTLDREGRISIPKVGTINLAGVKLRDLQATLQSRVDTIYKEVRVDAGMGKLRGVTVYVVGQALSPGAYTLSSLSTMLNAIFASGGPNATGSMRNITLMRAGKPVAELDLYDFIVRGDKSRDVSLQPGDVISIAPAGPRVALAGATDAAAIYELSARRQESVQQLLAYSGGMGPLADHRKALLERLQPTQQAAREVLSLDLAKDGLQRPLKGGDIVTLLPVSPAFANAVTLRGAVAQALRQPWTPGMRVRDLIPNREALISPDYYRQRNALVQNRTAEQLGQGLTPAQVLALDNAQNSAQDPRVSELIIRRNPDGKMDGAAANTPANTATPSNTTSAPTPGWPLPKLSAATQLRTPMRQINWEYATIERLNKRDLRTEIIGFNLGKALDGNTPADNPELQAGDVVTVLSSAELQLPVERRARMVRIEGEVAAPGLYEVQPGETLPQLLQRIGGLTPQAYLYGAEFTRESVRQQQQQNLDQLIRKLESQLQSAGATQIANLTSAQSFQVATLQQQQQDMMRSQIARLKTLRSQGRVALELDADTAYTLLTSHVDRGTERSATQNKLLAALPPVPLEDGDRLVVPTVPAFVSAVGAVNSENAFIYRTGRTASDIIAAAGLTEDADSANAFVLRADGTVISRGKGWLSGFGSTRLLPGDTLVVPTLVDRESKYNFLVRGLKDWTQILSNFGVGAAALKSLGY